jgi:membrane-associated protease RseP (regulator of RpoE activity)
MKEMTFEIVPLVPTKTIGEALTGVWREPAQLIRQWNYKGAIMSGSLRAPIFLITYLVGRESIKLALAAALAQFIFRFAFAGVGGALIQSFRRVEPAWKALAAILLIVPVISHFFEFLVQAVFGYFTQTGDHTDEAILRSVCISILSALFSLFLMRHDVMIVGEAESKSIWSDIARLPVLIFEFLAFIPLEIAGMLRRGDYLKALASVTSFGIFAELLGWAITNKPYWTYNKGKMSFASFWGIDGLILLIIGIALAAIFLHRKKKLSEIK